MIRSISEAVTPAWASAISAARVPKCDVVWPSAAIWRCRMPVRCSIHSSDVSIRPASSAFESTRLGRQAPTPRTTERSFKSVMKGGVPKGAANSRRRCRGGGRSDFVGLPDHFVADLDRAGEALGVRPAMTLDDDAVKAEKNAAVDASWVHLVAQGAKRVAGEPISQPRKPRLAHRVAHVLAELFGGSFGGLQRDIAGEAFGYDHIDGALAQIVALDEPVIVEVRQFSFPEHAAGGLHLFDALDFLDPHVEETDGRAFDVEQDARHCRPHDRKIDQMLSVGADRRADVEHDRFSSQGRPHRGDRGPFDQRQHM